MSVKGFAHIYCDCDGACGWVVWVESYCRVVRLKPCYVLMCLVDVTCLIIQGSIIFSNVFAVTERSEMGLYDMSMGSFLG